MEQEFLNNRRFIATIAAFDAYNSKDPNRYEFGAGISLPRELMYARQMSNRLRHYKPDASEVVHLAARCQHIGRWETPRQTYPDGKAGYHQWRNTLREHHMKLASGIMRQQGYDESVVNRVCSLIDKENLKTDAESQLLEDVVCLVFLEYYFDEFIKKHDDTKVLEILAKTIRKISPKAHDAIKTLTLSDRAQALIEEAAKV